MYVCFRSTGVPKEEMQAVFHVKHSRESVSNAPTFPLLELVTKQDKCLQAFEEPASLTPPGLFQPSRFKPKGEKRTSLSKSPTTNQALATDIGEGM